MQIIANNGGVFATNSYLVADEISKQAVIFDAPNDTVAPLVEHAKKNGWNVIGLWLTHGHIDHIADHEVVTKAFPEATVFIHELDQHKLQNPRSVFQLPFVTKGRSADRLIAENDHLHIGNIPVHVYHTPGHSPGHVMFHLPDQKVLIGGDVILMGAVGRTDFPDCSFEDLMKSIKRIMKLDPETTLLPGHGTASTLAHELQTNPYVQQAVES